MNPPGQHRYNDFLKIFKEENNGLTKENQYKKAQKLRNEVKSNSEFLANTIRQLKTKAAKRKGTIEGFWTKAVASHQNEKNKGKKLTNSLAPTPMKINQQLL